MYKPKYTTRVIPRRDCVCVCVCCVCVYSRKYVYSHANYNNLGKLVSGGNIDGINTYTRSWPWEAGVLGLQHPRKKNRGAQHPLEIFMYPKRLEIPAKKAVI